MDKELIKYWKEDKKQELKDAIANIKDDQIISMVDQRAVKGRGDPCTLVRAVFAGLLLSSDTCVIKVRLHVYKHCIKLLQSSEMNAKTASELVGILLMEADEFNATCLAELAAMFVDSIKSGVRTGKSLEILPKVLSALELKEMVSYGGHELSGTEYKSYVLNNLCSGRWDSGTVIHLAAMFKDVPLTQDELQFVLTKILRMLKEVEMQELPPLVYQVLLLATKGHKRMVLEGIIKYFVEQDKRVKEQTSSEDAMEVMSVSKDQLGLIEGTIILHISFAAKQDQELGREFIKYLKNEQQNQSSIALSPFNVALALSFSRIHRFEEQIFDFLKTAIVRSFKDQEKQTLSAWTRDAVPTVSDISDWFMDTVRHSVHGWDHVIQGLVELGFTLMDSYGPKAAFGRITDTSGSLTTSPTQQACQLGSTLLLETFKTHEMVRADILEQILNRVVTKATAPVTHYLELLSQTVLSAPQVILDSLPKVREAFDYLSYLPPPTAVALLKAVRPLLKISMTLKDSLILVLRKAMFSRQVDARKTAVNGFMMILKHFRVLGGLAFSQASQSLPSSQIQVDVHIPYNPTSNEGLCLEILGNLRRCLSQQADVRMTLYTGLYDVLCRNTQLAGPMIAVLYQQVQKYYEQQEDTVPPLKLEPCIIIQGQDVYTSEPLAHLLACTMQCYLKMKTIQEEHNDDDDEDEDDVQDDVKKMMESLTLRMVNSELEDFHLDKSADFSMGTKVGVRNNIFALLLAGVYEVLLEYVFRTGDCKHESCETVLSLYHNYHRVQDMLKEKPAAGAGGSGAGGKRGRPTGGKPTGSGTQGSGKQKSLVSLSALREIVRALYSDELPAHQEGLNHLRESLDFQHYVLSMTCQKLGQISSTGSCDGPEGHDASKLFTFCTSLARVLQKKYTSDVHNTEENRRERQKQVTHLAVENLTLIYNIVCTRYKDRLHDFLSAVDQSRASGVGPSDLDLPDLVHKLIKKFQRMVISVVTAEDDHHTGKEAVSLLSIIQVLTEQLGLEGERGAQVVSWLQRLCTEQNIADVALAKVLMTHFLQMTTKQQSCVQVLRSLARDIHSQLGDIDQEAEIDTQASMAVVNMCTAAPTMLILLTSHMERELDDTEWVINRLKGALGATSSGDTDADSPGLTQREMHEKTLCSRLGHLVNALHELCQSAIPVGNCILASLKVTSRMYNTLTLLVKYYLQMYQLKCGHISARFEKLVRLSGTNLTQYVYSMITYIQATQNESLQQASEKTKKDKKKQENLAQSGKAQVMKETKAIPNLIFAIEQYERFLIQLSKKSKADLMNHFKMSTARDFRINVASLNQALDGQQTDEEDETEETMAVDSESDDGEQENREPSPHSVSKGKASDRASAKRANTSTVQDDPPRKKSKLGSRITGNN